MNMIAVETKTRGFSVKNKDRRVAGDRRLNPGRRGMIRFDATGGDRRSGNARRSTDEGLIPPE